MLLTLLEYFPKVLVLTGAVPAAIAKLVLTFPDAQFGALGHLADNLWLSLAQLCLFASEALGLPADTVGIHDQRTAHRPEEQDTHTHTSFRAPPGILGVLLETGRPILIARFLHL